MSNNSFTKFPKFFTVTVKTRKKIWECWSVGVLECWSVGVLECWSVGSLYITPILQHSNTPIFKRLRQYLTVGDKILIGSLLLLSLASFPLVRAMTKAGNAVQIETDGKVYKTVSLYEDQTLTVSGPLGETFVIIHDGEVHVSESPCPNKICIKTGHISLSGQIIACVPNKVVVRVTGEQEAEYDAVTQ